MGDPVLVGNSCLGCKGTGTIDGEFCHSCLGTGYRATIAESVYFKQMSDKIDNISDKIDDILTPSLVFRSYLIVEALDTTEYNALTDAQKLNFIMIVSAGFVDLNTDSNAKALLMALFGAGTTTRANLIELIS